MLLPFFGFLMVSAVVCGIASLVAAADARAAKVAPLAYPVASASLGVFGFALVIGSLDGLLSSDASGLLVLLGSPAIILGGGLLGYPRRCRAA